jgi:predicted O-methyltransferase YrrM
MKLNLARWNKVWLSKPWMVRPVPGTCQIELHGVKGFLIPGDVSYLFNLATELPLGGCYLEIGSWLGLSSIIVANGLIASLNFRARIFCVDTWRGSPEHRGMGELEQDRLYSEFLENLRGAGVESLIEPMRGESRQVAQEWHGPGLDVIFIDGEHSFQACWEDISNWHPKLKPGGRLLGHDAAPGSEVERAVRHYCRDKGYQASICPMPASHFIWEIQA